jgi:hypothetical protein
VQQNQAFLRSRDISVANQNLCRLDREFIRATVFALSETREKCNLGPCDRCARCADATSLHFITN